MKNVLDPVTVNFSNQSLICRNYDCLADPEKIIQTLYPMLSMNNGIEVLKREDQEFFYNSDSNFRLVAELNTKLVSSIVIMCDKNFPSNLTVELFSVVTLKEYQGTGISQIMFDYTITWIRKIGGKKIKLWTYIDNCRAQKFYEKVGFKKIARENEKIFYQMVID